MIMLRRFGFYALDVLFVVALSCTSANVWNPEGVYVHENEGYLGYVILFADGIFTHSDYSWDHSYYGITGRWKWQGDKIILDSFLKQGLIGVCEENCTECDSVFFVVRIKDGAPAAGATVVINLDSIKADTSNAVVLDAEGRGSFEDQEITRFRIFWFAEVIDWYVRNKNANHYTVMLSFPGEPSNIF